MKNLFIIIFCLIRFHSYSIEHIEPLNQHFATPCDTVMLKNGEKILVKLLTIQENKVQVHLCNRSYYHFEVSIDSIQEIRRNQQIFEEENSLIIDKNEVKKKRREKFWEGIVGYIVGFILLIGVIWLIYAIS